MQITPIEDAPKLTEADLQSFEHDLACALPEDYRQFLLMHNGGFPSPSCVTFEEAGCKTTSDVLCFHALGVEQPWGSLDFHFEIFGPRIPEHTVPMAHDSCGNLWLLAIGPDHQGKVFFWDHGTYDTFDESDLSCWPQVAASFQDFVSSLQTYDPTFDDDDIASRYALVAHASMAMKMEDVPTHEYAWHCHPDDDGSMSLQCVQYVPHAAFTHTDGYSVMRAVNGIIEEGETRLPE